VGIFAPKEDITEQIKSDSSSEKTEALPAATNSEKTEALPATTNVPLVTAKELPWYPDDFREHFKTGVAFKLLDERPSCYDCTGSVYEVVTKSGCPNGLYVEANVLDASGIIVDFTNDVVSSLPLDGRAKIELYSYESGATRLLVTKVSCS